MTMTYVLWGVQGLLALLFLFTGGMKLVLPLEVMTEQTPLPGSARPDTAGRRRAGDHHDRCDGAHAGGSCAGRWCRGGADPAGGGTTLGVCSLRSLATGAASRVVSPVRAPAVQLRRVVIALRCLLYSMELTVLKWVGTNRLRLHQ